MVPLFLSLWWNEYVVYWRRIPMANAVGTACTPNFLMLQAMQAGSIPTFAGEFSGVSHRSGRKEWAVSLFHTSCPLKRWPSWLFPDSTKFTRKLPTAVMVEFAFTKFIVFFWKQTVWGFFGVFYFFFFAYAAFLVKKGFNTSPKSERKVEKSPKGIKSLLNASKQLFPHLLNSGGIFSVQNSFIKFSEYEYHPAFITTHLKLLWGEKLLKQPVSGILKKSRYRGQFPEISRSLIPFWYPHT